MNRIVNFEIYLELRISGDIVELDNITRLLEITPTEIHIKGKIKSDKIQMIAKENCWSYKFGKTVNESVSDLLLKLRQLLSDKESIMLNISNEMDVTVFMAIYKYEYWPSFVISKENITFLHSIGSKVELDLY